MTRRPPPRRTDRRGSQGPPPEPRSLTLKGIPASPGVAIGRAFLLDSEEVAVAKQAVAPAAVP